MTSRCSFCGGIGNNIRFKTGYVCEECLNYIKRSDLTSDGERESGSNENVNGSEKNKIKTDVRQNQ